METLQFGIDIDAAPGKVWNKLWTKEGYDTWTAAFTQGSYMEGELKPGSKVHFMAPDGRGMYSIVFEMEENKKMVFKHIGEMKDNEEQPIDEKTKEWSGYMESYELQPAGNGTHLDVQVDAADSFKDYLNSKFPDALAILKKISEQ